MHLCAIPLGVKVQKVHLCAIPLGVKVQKVHLCAIPLGVKGQKAELLNEFTGLERKRDSSKEEYAVRFLNAPITVDANAADWKELGVKITRQNSRVSFASDLI
ncbi:MAG: hypothetical protein IPG59_12740 [Candidatus Melainabacteria bacterium]|nr:MAG: hypothetical protein IPG59_12740 [Candidatus Melainabacteria bacterium]